MYVDANFINVSRSFVLNLDSVFIINIDFYQK